VTNRHSSSIYFRTIWIYERGNEKPYMAGCNDWH